MTKDTKKATELPFFNISLMKTNCNQMDDITEQRKENKEQEIHKSHNTGEFSVLRLNESQFLGGFTFEVYRGLQRI